MKGLDDELDHLPALSDISGQGFSLNQIGDRNRVASYPIVGPSTARRMDFVRFGDICYATFTRSQNLRSAFLSPADIDWQLILPSP